MNASTVSIAKGRFSPTTSPLIGNAGSGELRPLCRGGLGGAGQQGFSQALRSSDRAAQLTPKLQMKHMKYNTIESETASHVITSSVACITYGNGNSFDKILSLLIIHPPNVAMTMWRAAARLAFKASHLTGHSGAFW
jgi:hypothetical protein